MQDSQDKERASRRAFFAGAATLGAAATAVAVLPRVEEPAPAAPQAATEPERGGGYQLSEHIKRYYRSAAA